MDNNLLNDRIGKLKEWEQTESINEILYSTLSSLHTYANDRFNELTREIRDEFALNSNPPVIKVAVCLADGVDKQIFLRPVAIDPPANSPKYLTTVFAGCDYQTIQKLLKQTYTAKINGEAESFQTQVELKYSLKYLHKLESLYYAYNGNELPWVTVNGQYFYKFLDVYCKRDVAHLKIKEFDIDFAEFNKYISYDKELLWNVGSMIVPVAECETRPAYNAIQYEHMLKNIPLDEDQYLVGSLGEKFNSFRRGKEIFVRTYKKQYEQIELLRIISGDDTKNPIYLPVKSNKREPGLINSLAKGRFMPTWGEAERIIYSLGEASKIRLVDIKPLPCPDENLSRYIGLDYNYFREEHMVVKDRRPLLFTFDINTDEIWAYETMFYVLSELQLYFYDFRCVGSLV
jgi:hypothetical protein